MTPKRNMTFTLVSDYTMDKRQKPDSSTRLNILTTNSSGVSPQGIMQDQWQTSFQCPHCPEILPDNFHLKNHISHRHGHFMQYTCSLCGKGYQTSMGLHYHMQRHGGKKFICTICDQKFTRDSSLKLHVKKLHKSAKCPTCSGIFKLGQDYTQHVVSCGH